MRSYYTAAKYNAIADVCFMDGHWFITRINVPEGHRGNGVGSALLRAVLEEADREGITLRLWASPSGGLNRRQLEDWYGRYGFKKLSTGHMEREPNARSGEQSVDDNRGANQAPPGP